MVPVPASLKSIQPFLTKAEEMKSDPIVAYYCTYWAVQCAITLGVRDPDANIFLANLLTQLEQTKSASPTVEAITDDVVGRAYMQNFAANIFGRADDELRQGKAGKGTAGKFLAAAQFMEVLRCFGDLDKEVRIHLVGGG
jgi:vacuolar protein sorting-associated protein VTA1